VEALIAIKDRLMNRISIILATMVVLLAGPLPQAPATKLLSYDGSVFPHNQLSEGQPESVGSLAVVGGVPGTELDDWDGFNLNNTTVSNGVMSIKGSQESRFWYDLAQHNFADSIWTNGWQIRARLRLPNAPNINYINGEGSSNPIDHPYRWQGGPHYSGYGGGHEYATHIYIAQSGREDLGRLYRFQLFTDNTGDHDPILNLSQYFFEPQVNHEIQGKAGQFVTIDMINTQGRGGAVDLYVDGTLAIENNRPTAGLGEPLGTNADIFFVGDCCGISGPGTLDIDYVELYDGIGGLPGPFSNPEPSSGLLLFMGTAYLASRRR
jgi:hypothetical protein